MKNKTYSFKHFKSIKIIFNMKFENMDFWLYMCNCHIKNFKCYNIALNLESVFKLLHIYDTYLFQSKNSEMRNNLRNKS